LWSASPSQASSNLPRLYVTPVVHADIQWSLHKDHPDRRSLLRNSIYKLVIVLLAVLGAIGFGVTYALCGGDILATSRYSAAQCGTITSACAALEWTIAFLLTLYFATLIADLWPAGKSSPRYMRRLARWQEKNGEGDDFTGRGAFEEHPENWMTADQRAETMQREMEARNRGLAVDHHHHAQGNNHMGNGPVIDSTPRMSEASTAPMMGRAV
jgi:hypothetical protein